MLAFRSSTKMIIYNKLIRLILLSIILRPDNFRPSSWALKIYKYFLGIKSSIPVIKALSYS